MIELSVSQVALNTRETGGPKKPHASALTSMFSQYTGHLMKHVFEARFGLLQYVFPFLFITHFHSRQIGSRGPENV